MVGRLRLDHSSIRVRLVASAVILLGVGLVMAPRTASAAVICWNASVPSGYVVTSYTNSGSCGSANPNAKVIQLAYDGIVACWNSPIPSNYVITGYTLSGGCGSASPNAKTLRIAYSGIVACWNSPRPSGYYVGSYRTVYACGSGTNNAVVLYQS